MLGFGTELSYYWSSLIRILYPANCVLCRTPLVLEETYLCTTCSQKIEPLKTPACVKCAHPLPPYGNQRSICSQCRSERPYYDRGFSLVPYQEPMKDILHQVKFHKKPWLLKIFFDRSQAFALPQIANYELIVPVPLDSKRERERTFNQAILIAQMLKRSIQKNAPQVLRIIQKKKKTLPQSQLKRDARLNNLKNAFLIKKKRAVQGKQILLVDDIFTTGSTINECAKILKENGAERVDFFTVARSQFSS